MESQSGAIKARTEPLDTTGESIINPDGDKEYKFHTYYYHDGKTFGATFYAKDFDDARKKVGSIRRTLNVEDVSQVLEEFENRWFYIQWVKFTTWVKDVFHR